MNKEVRFKGKILHLKGYPLEEGEKAPSSILVSSQLEERNIITDFKGKVRIINTFPSLDTPVCDLQVKEFNKKTADFSPETTVVIGISKDLPFAQKRFCDSYRIHNVFLFSDYRYSSFGINYGLLIKELNLLTRAVVIIDKDDYIRYIQIPEEITNPIDYDKVWEALDKIINSPLKIKELSSSSHCKPCEGGIKPLLLDKIKELLPQYPGWQFTEDNKLKKEFKFRDFKEAKDFFDVLFHLAEKEGHHPNITVIYNKVRVTLTTHIAGGLTENDFIMAKLIDRI